MSVSLILACAGKGVRAGFDKNKLLVRVNDTPFFMHTFNAFENSGLINQYIVVASKEDFDFFKSTLPPFVEVVVGGNTRTQSVKNGLEKVTGDIVLIHDGARPFVSARIINDCIESATKFGNGITAIPTRDTIFSVKDGVVKDYLGKDGIYKVQTPQAFRTEEIKKAYTLAEDKPFNDDGEVYKKYIGELRLVLGERQNTKLTFREDFSGVFNNIIVSGVGFDCHKLVENRKLILGGVEIPHDKGLLGHSDADVLTHAIMDALLSALSLRDIGYHFPDTDPKYKGANSIKLLEEVLKMVKEKGYAVGNVSATILAEKPKLLKHIPTITENLAKVLDISADKLGIGATTLEGLGFVGREEGICVHAVCTLKKI